MGKMKKWIKYSDKKFGVFNELESFGIEKKSSDDYTIGKYNKNGELDGLVIAREPGHSMRLNKVTPGMPMFPVVDISEGYGINIMLKIKNGKSRTFYLNQYSSTFEFFLSDMESDFLMDGYKLLYAGRLNEFSVEKYENDIQVGKTKIQRKFIPDKPIICPGSLILPKLNDFDSFNYVEEADYAMCENSSKDTNGVGVISWDNGAYSIGGWADGQRQGWQLYQFPDGSYSIFQADKANYKGLLIEFLQNDDVNIQYYANDGQNIDHSYMIKCRKNGEFVFSDYKDGKFIGQGVIFDENKLRFVNFIDGKEQDDEVICFDDLFKEVYLKKEETKIEEPKKEEIKTEEIVDKDDPEYQIMHLVGQSDVKKEFNRIKAYIQKNEVHKHMHMIFTGSNGVGKSTVAKLMAKILCKYGVTRHESYVERSAQELFISYSGEMNNRLDELYRLGSGGVILIDDIHYLDQLNNSNIKEGIVKLAKLMEDDINTVFILVDSKYNMKQFMDNNYELLQHNIRFKINFQDFTKEELSQILQVKIKEKGYEITDDALDGLLNVIYLAKSYGNNINASAAFAILEEIIVAQNVRTERDEDKLITKEDIGVYINDNDMAFIDQKTGGQSDARKKLDELVGLEHIKDMVDDLIAYFAINRGKRVDFHMVFTGNPGTGKTEVARIIGKLLRQEGILSTSKFIEVTRKDLVGEYIGQTAVKTNALIDKAMGGVLYIDEAYSLAYGGERDFGAEAIAELLKAMEDRRGEFCVIMAGYTSEMKKLFDLNPGLKSRIKFDLDFPDYKDEEFDKLARLFLKRDNNLMSEENIKLLVKLVTNERNLPNFANVRTLREYISRIQIKQARRIRQSQDENINVNELTYEDILGAFGQKAIEDVTEKEKIKVEVPKINPDKLINEYKNIKDMPYLYNKEIIADSVVAIRNLKENGKGEASGFVISKDGYVATCAHCVKDSKELKVRRRLYHHGRQLDIYYDANIASVDYKLDLAILKLDTEDEFDFVALENKDYKPEQLQKVYMLGYPFGFSRFDTMSVNEGRVISYQKGKDMPDQINLDIDAKSGNSGSLIIDGDTSKVIGILVGSSISRGNEVVEEINYCRPVSYLWNLMESELPENKKRNKEDLLNSWEYYYDNDVPLKVRYEEYIERTKEVISFEEVSYEKLKNNKDNVIHMEKGSFEVVIQAVVDGICYMNLLERIYEHNWRKVRDIVLKVGETLDDRLDVKMGKGFIRFKASVIRE